MTTIKDLPSEILLVVLDNVQKTDLLECLKVCQSWYSPAHNKILQNVTLNGKHAIEQFVNIFNEDTKTSYADAVKTIDYHFFANFDDDICENILKNCPKLKAFNTNSFQFINKHEFKHEFKHLYKIRLLMNCLEWRYIFLAHKIETNAEQFLAMFPRVRTITRGNNEPSFKKFLSIVQYISGIQRIELLLTEDKDNFAKTYMEQQTAEVRDLITKNLSLVTDLKGCFSDMFCLNSVKFACMYYTGLETLRMTSSCKNWTTAHEQAFCDNFLDLVCSVKKSTDVMFETMKRTTMKRCLPVILSKVFHHAPATCKKKILQIALIDYEFLKDKVNLCFTQEDHKREICIVFGVSRNTKDIVSRVLNTSLDIVEEFKLLILCEEYVTEKAIDIYSLLKKMPGLKSVVLQVPDSFAVNTELVKARVEKFALERTPRESAD